MSQWFCDRGTVAGPLIWGKLPDRSNSLTHSYQLAATSICVVVHHDVTGGTKYDSGPPATWPTVFHNPSLEKSDPARRYRCASATGWQANFNLMAATATICRVDDFQRGGSRARVTHQKSSCAKVQFVFTHRDWNAGGHSGVDGFIRNDMIRGAD